MKTNLVSSSKSADGSDLNNYKFYINYFALMPYLLNKENQNNLAYLDFQNIRQCLSKWITKI